ncbi:hypothetical protein [Nitrosopumilus sp.]|nr:hypothetical protein [Nitrosopumilus sp.]
MHVKKTYEVERLQKIMKAKLENKKNIPRKEIKQVMDDYVNS